MFAYSCVHVTGSTVRLTLLFAPLPHQRINGEPQNVWRALSSVTAAGIARPLVIAAHREQIVSTFRLSHGFRRRMLPDTVNGTQCGINASSGELRRITVAAHLITFTRDGDNVFTVLSRGGKSGGPELRLS